MLICPSSTVYHCIFNASTMYIITNWDYKIARFEQWMYYFTSHHLQLLNYNIYLDQHLVLWFSPAIKHCSCQGPALYAYNDAEFRQSDWKGIRMLHDSVKVKDPMKVGRFGLGFKSVLHMTGKTSSGFTGFQCITGILYFLRQFNLYIK
jgi:hypothetical protein